MFYELLRSFRLNGRLVEGGRRAQGASNSSCSSNMKKTGGINYTNEAKDVRKALTNYFVEQGTVPWQNGIVDYDGRRSDV